jgi:glycosyltransferase involved in cell wall biosynthesis
MTLPTLTVIIPSIGNELLQNTFASIRRQEILPGDEVLVVGDGHQPYSQQLCEREGHPFRYLEYGGEKGWGHPQANFAIPQAKGDYILWMDEDDVYTDGAWQHIRRFGAENPGKILMFRSVWPDYRLFWDEPKRIQEAYIGGHNIVTPNVPEKIGRWGHHYEGDFTYIRETVDNFGEENIAWSTYIISDHRPHQKGRLNWLPVKRR